MNILIISPSWIGDMMMSHSLFQTLKKNYIDCKIDVIAPNWCLPLLTLMPEVNRPILMPIGHGILDVKSRYRMGKSLRHQYQLAITLPNSFKSALIPLFAKIPQRRGWKGESRYYLLNDLRKNKQNYPLMVQRYVSLGYEKDAIPTAEQLSIPYPYLHPTSEDIIKTKQLFAAKFPMINERAVIGFCPGAEFGPAKRWPDYHYTSLAKILIAQGYTLCLFGSGKDKLVGQQICNRLTDQDKLYCINLCGQTDLKQAIHLLAGCHAVVSNDSGLMHIAAALKRPLIALYGPTSPEYTPPLTDNAIIIRLVKSGLIKIRQDDANAGGYHQSMIDIEPKKVADELDQLLS